VDQDVAVEMLQFDGLLDAPYIFVAVKIAVFVDILYQQ
jgi:hypothetical protein